MRHHRRIYIDTTLSTNDIIDIYNEQKHYLITVLRLKIGDYFRVFNGQNGEYTAQITAIHKNHLEIKLTNILKVPVSEHKLSLGLSIIKANKMLDAIDIAVQLGVTDITPIISERSQFKTLNYTRAIKCIIEATEQSERLTPPTLHRTITFSQYINSIVCNDIIVYANELEQNVNIIQLSDVLKHPISLIIGPEGGFAQSELQMLSVKSNSHSVTLSTNILRTETAVAAALAQIQMIYKTL